ncbi:MAG: propionyl-CoA synthetase [Acidiphilium sp. 37-64-53]|uniref:AMP-binding protein n=1 Tax=Acidiphilium TaxID=522 RepID=UPI000BCF4C53|nr:MULTISPECIES: AMP-binding protein [Acidiphilium]OYW01168.1 MAG: propionyl-CoA synthetase [Acidiphilium sp. 37-64-53]OZB28719.1 MAG: propionyl-CoA synthetase [Acidiphilium sp. 34-64-41]HQT85479.1 AMP-binding protein [Acidiphilium rubrum]
MNELYWAEAAKAIDWIEPYQRVFDPDIGPFGRWFTGGVLNTSVNCLDRHVEAGAGERVALIWDSAMEGRVAQFTYRVLRDRVAKLAGAMAARGVVKGDRVVIYMPMVPEAAIAMLACARLGAVHSVVFGGFAAPELAARIDAAQPRLVIAASCGLEPGRVVAYKPILDAALDLAAHRPEACLIFQREALRAELLAGRDEDFSAAEAAGIAHDPVPVAATDPLYVLYTSGTTGKPKGIVRDNGGHAVALAHSVPLIFDVRPGPGAASEVMWTASDVGWVVGHTYIVYAPLLAGVTSVMYEGKPVGTPDAGAFWRVCAQHKVKTLFTAPTALRAIKQQDPEGAMIGPYDLSALEALFLAGERCDPPTATWIAGLLGKPVIDNWWQTETGWPISARFRGTGLTPFKPGSGGRACPGFDVQALDPQGDLMPAGEVGALAIRLPLPPGCAPTLWNDDAGYRRAYLEAFPGWYRTGDAGAVDAEGDIWVMGRTDDIINVAGHRLSTGAMEEVLAAHPDVAECAVIGRHDDIKGEIPFGLVVLKSGVERDEAVIADELVALVRERIGPVAAFKTAVIVQRLPKTRSGKILRATMKQMANGMNPVVPPTIEDASVLEAIAGKLTG